MIYKSGLQYLGFQMLDAATLDTVQNLAPWDFPHLCNSFCGCTRDNVSCLVLPAEDVPSVETHLWILACFPQTRYRYVVSPKLGLHSRLPTVIAIQQHIVDRFRDYGAVVPGNWFKAIQLVNWADIRTRHCQKIVTKSLPKAQQLASLL